MSTINRTTTHEQPLADVSIADETMDGAYAVDVTVWAPGVLWGAPAPHTVRLSVDEAKALFDQLRGVIIEAHQKHREDHPTSPVPAFDLAGEQPIPDADPVTLQPDGSREPQARYSWVSGPPEDGIPTTGIRDRATGTIRWYGVVGVEVDRGQLAMQALLSEGEWVPEGDREWTETADA